jgi:hypothetical protein
MSAAQVAGLAHVSADEVVARLKGTVDYDKGLVRRKRSTHSFVFFPPLK